MSTIEKIVQSNGPSLIPLKTGFPRSEELQRADFLKEFQKKRKINTQKSFGFVDMLLHRGV